MFNLRLKVSLIFILAAIAVTQLQSSFAHKVEISEDVGATLHIEPNDNPKAGEPSQVWFALTREGGKVIPLNKCDCKLSIFSEIKSSQVILQPPLKPLSTEGYKNIPSAEVTFPKIGRYNLEITGKPIGGDDFKPFELNFKITIATAIPQVSPTIPNPNSGFKAVNPDRYVELPENQLIPVMTGVGIMAIGIILVWTLNIINK